MLKITDHTNIIKLHDYAERGGFLVLVIERPVHVQDVYYFLKHHKPLQPAMAKSLFRQILMGAIHCHVSGVFHSDIKPQNILVDLNTSQAKIIDFGCGCELTSQYCCSRKGKLNFMETNSSLSPLCLLTCAPFTETYFFWLLSDAPSTPTLSSSSDLHRRQDCPKITYMTRGFRPHSFPVGRMYVQGLGRLTKVKKNSLASPFHCFLNIKSTSQILRAYLTGKQKPVREAQHC